MRPDDVLQAPRKRGEDEKALPRFDLKFRLEDRPELAEAITKWITEVWTPWSAVELPRRRTIALYQILYKIFQLTGTRFRVAVRRRRTRCIAEALSTYPRWILGR